MSNFFDYNIDTQQYDGSVFEVDKTREELWQEWVEINKKIEKQITNYNGYLPIDILPMPLRFLFIFGMTICISYIKALFGLLIGEVTLTQAYANAPGVVISGICAFSVTVPLVLFLIVMKILHNMKDHSDLMREKYSIWEKICKEWNIPTDLTFYTADVLSAEYLENSTEKTICKKYKHRYKVQEWVYFLQNNTLYFTDYQRLFAIEMSKIVSLSTVENKKKIYMANSTENSDRANISCFIPGYYGVKGYGGIQISGSFEQFEILVPAYNWDNAGIKTVIDEYRNALKVYLENQKEIVFYKAYDYLVSEDIEWNECFISEDVEWDEYDYCCAELIPANLQKDEVEQVKSDFLSIIGNAAAWNEKLMPLIEEKTGKSKAAYDNEELGFIGFQVKSKHEVSFWYDIDECFDEYFIEIFGSLEDDLWTARKSEDCNMLG